MGVRDGALTVGVSSERFDLGRMLVDALPESDPTDGTNLLAWGPGRLDVTTTAGIEPVRIPDLRPVRFLTHLHHDGTVAQRGLATLAIRLETLIITSNGRTVRPPREVALGLATYLWSMGEAMRERATETDAERRGMAYFNGECARCHAPKGFTGPPVPLDEVGTDPALGRSPDRTTGKYRVPSLRGVSTRGPLLHDATLPSLDALFDPARTSTDYKGALHGVKGVGGHTFGLALDAASRADLLAYLRTL